MAEKALAVPFDTEEIIEIAVEQFRRRLKGLSPLQGMKQYSGFELSFNTSIKLFGMATNGGGVKETLAWGRATAGDTGADAEPVGAMTDVAMHTSDPDVNKERLDHDLPLTVETGDGKGGKVTKKVRIKGGKGAK
jgi:hypothetical protein